MGNTFVKKPPIFGGYDFKEEEDLSRMAMDITTVVHGVLRHGSGETDGPGIDELSAAGDLLEWAQEYLAWHGLRGDKEINAMVSKRRKKRQGEQGARRGAR